MFIKKNSALKLEAGHILVEQSSDERKMEALADREHYVRRDRADRDPHVQRSLNIIFISVACSTWGRTFAIFLLLGT